MKKHELEALVQECISEVINERHKGYDEFQRADKGKKGVVAKDKGEEDVYGAGYAAGEKAAKAKYKKLAEIEATASDGGYYNKPERAIIVSQQEADFINKIIKKFKSDILSDENAVVVNNTKEGKINQVIINNLKKHWNVQFEHGSEDGDDYVYLSPNQNLEDVNDALEYANQIFYDKIKNQTNEIQQIASNYPFTPEQSSILKKLAEVYKALKETSYDDEDSPTWDDVQAAWDKAGHKSEPLPPVMNAIANAGGATMDTINGAIEKVAKSLGITIDKAKELLKNRLKEEGFGLNKDRSTNSPAEGELDEKVNWKGLAVGALTTAATLGGMSNKAQAQTAAAGNQPLTTKMQTAPVKTAADSIDYHIARVKRAQDLLDAAEKGQFRAGYPRNVEAYQNELAKELQRTREWKQRAAAADSTFTQKYDDLAQKAMQESDIIKGEHTIKKPNGAIVKIFPSYREAKKWLTQKDPEGKTGCKIVKTNNIDEARFKKGEDVGKPGPMREITPAQEKYRAKPSPSSKMSDYKKDIIACKKMIDAGKAKEAEAKYPPEVFNAVNAIFEATIDEARFKKGEDIGKPGPGFKKVAKAATKEYGSKEAGQKVAGAILKKVLAKKK